MEKLRTEGMHRTLQAGEGLLPKECRSSVMTLLEEVYGYTSFRELEIYKDLSKGKDKRRISQGVLIEHVLREAEKAMLGKDDVNNILLTAPTGSGKSLLFQLPAIWLGREHGLLTIVISPLKALIEDQMESLRGKGYSRAAYASSDLSPRQKVDVYRGVREGETDLFYLSPELLLSYDIRHFIGERRIGLVVVDEAHTVTTWGREFRVDYWFLGKYLNALQKGLGYGFPIFALTATAVWNPSGANDMVYKTVSSLMMQPCVLYMGTVRRENIAFDIRRLKIGDGETYDKAKQRTVSERVAECLEGHKTLLYYPFAGGIDVRLNSWVRPADRHWVASYYGKKDKEQKAEIVRAFKAGEKKMIVATKAFGMGIDIRDIDKVYHVAPSGSFVDYVQEIGRAAREAGVHGVAATDFHERDFYYMRKLHGMGGMSQEQLRLILAKLVEVWRMKGARREVQVSMSDFEFAVRLPRAHSKLDYESELARFVKTALLWIEEDLAECHGRPVLEVSSRNLLAEAYVQDKAGDAFVRAHAAYLEPVEGGESVYRVRLEELWEACYPHLGYREFRQRIGNGTLLDGSLAVVVGRHDVLLKEDSADIGLRMDALLGSLTEMMRSALRLRKGRFGEEELRDVFARHGMDVRPARRFVYSLLESRTEEGRSVSYISSMKKRDSDELTFSVERGFDRLLSRYRSLLDLRIKGRKGSRLTLYCTPFSDLNMLLNLLSMTGSLTFSVEGGATPCVQIAFIAPDVLQRVADEGAGYRNHILDANEAMFEEQVRLFTMFFGTDKMDDARRWDFVEDYFTGVGVDELERKYIL